MGSPAKIAIVLAKFNMDIGERLLQGAQSCLKEHNIAPADLFHVPGAFEIPVAALQLIETKKYDGIICLGAVIRGETPHFEIVAGECARGIMQVGLQTKTPVIFGVLTTNTHEQAMQRSSEDSNNGWSAAITVLEMIKNFKDIKNRN